MSAPKKLVFAPTMAALEVWATAMGLGPRDVVDVLADPRRALRGREVEAGDLVRLEGAIGHPRYALALRLLPKGVEMPAPVSPLGEP